VSIVPIERVRPRHIEPEVKAKAEGAKLKSTLRVAAAPQARETEAPATPVPDRVENELPWPIPSKSSVRRLLAVVAKIAGVTPDQILSANRSYHIVAARHAAVRLAGQLWPSLSTVRLGRCFERDHSTIIFILGRSTTNKRILARSDLIFAEAAAHIADAVEKKISTQSQQKENANV